MVYLRTKTVKGERYLYLVKSVWDPKKNTSKQETIKYLGKSSEVTKQDIPFEYRNDPKVVAFLASDEAMDLDKRDEMLSKLQDQLFKLFMRGDLEGALGLYSDYRSTSGTTNFFERILTPVMYQVGELWAKNKISIADEHVCSNIANSLIRIIFSKNERAPTKKKILICTPEGEHHNLGPSILESHLSCSGFRVFNLAPSEPHESIVRFIESSKPDAILVSITLTDNIRPGQRLIKKIKEKFDIPIFVGGQAVKDQNISLDAQIIRESSLKSLPKLIN
ncbi:MAG: histidine kinase [Thaumarchaeota archaeon]|nr:histidine kinase [Nitrososphaerota archaeon]